VAHQSTNGKPNETKGFLTLGGNPVLDFCNTLVIHGDHTEDRLQDEHSARSFLRTFFFSKQLVTKKNFAFLVQLRASLRDYFLSTATQDKPKVGHTGLGEFLKKMNLIIKWDPKRNAFSQLSVADKDQKFLEPLIKEFFEFNQIMDRSRVKKCANANCSHLFYDLTKSKTRVWCSMQSCGNLMKARSFQARKRLK
jgi:predicted RNA-binding Zn ribbon-like protein